MARKTIALAVTAVLAISTLALAGELLQTVTFDRKDVSFNRAGGYDRIDLAGVPAMGPVGAPRLPLLVQALAIPAGASISGVEIVSADEIELPGEYSVGPAQKAVPLPMPGRTFKTELMAPDAAIYQRDALYPAAVATALSTGSLCGYRIGHVAVSPVRYNPVTKKLYFSQRITYRVRYQEGTAGAAIATKDQQTVFGQQARLLVANPGDVERFAPQVRRSASKSLPAGEYRSVIISGSASFDTVFARLAAWHTKKGYRDTVVNVSSIYSAYTGYDTPEKIRNFIIDAKNTWGTMYVLLGGKGDAMGSARNYVPCRKGWYVYEGGVDNDSIPSDWYYADLDGNWDANGNHIYGELADNVNMYSDVFVGRAPVTSVAGAQNFVAKTLTYEKNPPAGYLKKMLLPTGILWDTYEERPTQRAIAAMTPAGWLDDSLFERNGNMSEAIVVSHFNTGEGLGHWIGHGSADGIYYSGGTIPYYTSSDADAAANGGKQGIAISMACEAGGYDIGTGGDCLAEHLINKVNGGCIGVMMNSRYGWGAFNAGGNYVMGPSEMIDTSFMCNLLRRHTLTQGQAIAQAKNSWVPYADSLYQYNMMRWCIYELNLLGDPALPVLTGEPIALTVNHPSVALVGYNNFTVMVTDPAAVQGALVCLMTESHDSYVYDTTDASGSVTLHPAPVTPGQVMYVTVTVRNHQPYEGTATVIAPAGAFVLHLKHSIDDAAGIPDGELNPGEHASIPVWLKNLGADASNGAVMCALTTASPYVTVTDSVLNYGVIAAGDSAVALPGFGVTVAADCPHGTAVTFQLTAHDADTAWTSQFTETVCVSPRSPTPDNNAVTPLYYGVEDLDVAERAPTYHWTEIRDIGTQLASLIVNNQTQRVALPFAFNWYGSTYSDSVSVCTNGWVGFGRTTSTAYNNTVIPSSAPNVPAVFPLWDDLTASPAGSWIGYWQDADSSRFIIEFDSLTFNGQPNRLKFQVVLEESTAARPHYDVMIYYDFFADPSSDISVGFQKNSTLGCQMQFDSSRALTFAPIVNGRAIRITRSPNNTTGVASEPVAVSGVPRTYGLEKAYPNPARNAVSIAYQLPKASQMELTVYNIAGQKVRTLASGAKPAGYHTVRWDGRDETGKAVAAGVYLYRLTTPDYAKINKLTIVR